MKIKPKLGHWLLLGAILATAAFLRLYRLESLPRGPYYDEAANGILAAEIATGKAYPLFIRSYTGKEVLYFYAVAGMMKVLGISLLSMRLTSALFGVATVGATYWLALQLFAEEGEGTRRSIGLIAAALTAVSFWHIVISRYGFRAISQPLLQALMLGFLWRGLRRGGWANVVLAGILTGATAYTYLASRIVPVALLPWVVGAWIASHGERGRIAARIGALALTGALVFAPLGAFFLRNPETFGARMGQVSVLNPELNEGDLGEALWRSIGAAFGMFTVRGDPQSRFGVIGRPVFDPVVGALFYLGVLYALYRVFKGPRPHDRVLYGSLLLWVPLLLVPSILGVKEVPHSLRAIGVMPVLFLFPALGIEGEFRFLAGRAARLHRAVPLVSMILAALLLVSGGVHAGWDYFARWGNQAAPYYENDNDLADAARTLNATDTGEADLFASSIHYRHPTMAFLAEDYGRMRWLVGTGVIAFPAPEANGGIRLSPLGHARSGAARPAGTGRRGRTLPGTGWRDGLPHLPPGTRADAGARPAVQCQRGLWQPDRAAGLRSASHRCRGAARRHAVLAGLGPPQCGRLSPVRSSTGRMGAAVGQHGSVRLSLKRVGSGPGDRAAARGRRLPAHPTGRLYAVGGFCLAREGCTIAAAGRAGPRGGHNCGLGPGPDRPGHAPPCRAARDPGSAGGPLWRAGAAGLPQGPAPAAPG